MARDVDDDDAGDNSSDATCQTFESSFRASQIVGFIVNKVIFQDPMSAEMPPNRKNAVFLLLTTIYTTCKAWPDVPPVAPIL